MMFSIVRHTSTEQPLADEQRGDFPTRSGISSIFA
jgi:hypothetical protein